MSESRFKDGLAYYEAGDYKKAREVFQELVEIYPHRSEAWLNLGNVEYKLNVFPQAEKNWTRAIDINPMEANGYLNLGNLYFKQERYRKAVGYWEQFIKIKSTQPSAWLNLGLAYEQLGDMEKALAHYKKYMSLNPTSDEAIKLRKRFEMAQKTFANNIQVAEKALADGNLHYAKEAFEKTLPIYPGSAKAYKNYATVLYQLNDFHQALINYLKAHHLNPKDPGVLINIGVIYQKQGEPIDAIWAYHMALKLDCPDQAKVRRRLDDLVAGNRSRFSEYLKKAAAKAGKAEYHEAELMYRRLLELTPYCLDLQKQVKEGILKVEEVCSPVIRAAKVYYSLGEKAREEGRYDQALAYYNKYLDIQPEGDKVGEVKKYKTEIQQRIGAIISTLMTDDKPPDSIEA